MKGTLEFNLDDSADMQAYMRAVKSTKLAITLWEMDQYLRSQTKYGELNDDAHKALQDARDKLREIMSDNSIDLDELMS